MFARHGLEWSRLHAGREWDRLNDPQLRSVLEMLDPLTREALCRVLIHDQADRDEIASQLLRYRDDRGRDWADIIDFLTLDPNARRQVVRMLAEIDAIDTRQ
jgi:hypothetical protein